MSKVLLTGKTIFGVIEPIGFVNSIDDISVMASFMHHGHDDSTVSLPKYILIGNSSEIDSHDDLFKTERRKINN